VGELSPAAQAKLLRVIETQNVTALGATSARSVDVRIIAATNRNLEQAVASGRFRADLYYRLAIIRLSLSALSERPEDIEPIACHLLRQIADMHHIPLPRLSPVIFALLIRHGLPGNARELRNILEHAVITAENPDYIEPRDLPEPYLRHIYACTSTCTDAAYLSLNPRSDAEERAVLVAALNASAGKKSAAARALNCSRMTLYRRLERAGLSDEVRRV
jgi:two-component system, NtrC family, response regulator HydG